jgi:hypothetical protein
LVSLYLPFPPESGARQRNYFLWKALSEIAPIDVILCNDLLNHNVTAASVPASVNFLGWIPWRLKAHSLRRPFMKSTLNLTVERMLHAALPRDWDYEVESGVSRTLCDVLDRNRGGKLYPLN